MKVTIFWLKDGIEVATILTDPRDIPLVDFLSSIQKNGGFWAGPDEFVKCDGRVKSFKGEPMENLVDELEFRSYAHNRDLFPLIIPDRWKKVFVNGEALESRYQMQKKANDSVKRAGSCASPTELPQPGSPTSEAVASHRERPIPLREPQRDYFHRALRDYFIEVRRFNAVPTIVNADLLVDLMMYAYAKGTGAKI